MDLGQGAYSWVWSVPCCLDGRVHWRMFKVDLAAGYCRVSQGQVYSISKEIPKISYPIHSYPFLAFPEVSVAGARLVSGREVSRWSCWSLHFRDRSCRSRTGLAASMAVSMYTYYIHIWLVVWNISYFSISWEKSSQLTFIFFRGVAQPPTRHYILYTIHIYI